MNDTTQQYEDGRDDLPFMVHSELDDLDLTPYEFRAYAHIVRRTGRERAGAYWESLAKGAAHCRMALSSYRNAVTALVGKGLLTRRERIGQTSVITVTPKRKWRVKPAPPIESGTPATSGTPITSGRGTPITSDRTPLSHLIDKGNPIRESHEGSPIKTKGSEKPKPKAAKFDPLQAELPDNVPPELWAEFVAHRSEIKKKLTPTATKQLLTRLQGFGPGAETALRDSIANGWTGVFPPKDKPGTKTVEDDAGILDQYKELGL